jgi:hypothetical protein
LIDWSFPTDDCNGIVFLATWIGVSLEGQMIFIIHHFLAVDVFEYLHVLIYYVTLGFDDPGLQGSDDMGRGYGEHVNSTQRVII